MFWTTSGFTFCNKSDHYFYVNQEGPGAGSAAAAYNPQVEAISPTLPSEDPEVKSSKDELLTNINKVDKEITKLEAQIQKLKRKQVSGEVYGGYDSRSELQLVP